MPARGLERLWQGERQTVADHQRLLAAGAGGGREPVRALPQVAAARPGERAGERGGARAARGEVVRERRPAAVRGAGARVAAAVRAAVGGQRRAQRASWAAQKEATSVGQWRRC